MRTKIKIRSSDISLERSHDDEDFNNYYECFEDIENDFEIEFSCGDGLFYSDFFEQMFRINRGDLIANEESLRELNYYMEYYDGKVDTSLFRYKDTKKLFKNCYLSFIYNDSDSIHLEEERYSNFKVEVR